MEKKKKKRAAPTSTILESSSINLQAGLSTINVLRSKYVLQGAAFITITPRTQDVLNCLKERDVTNENPWVEVKKEAIEDNLFFYEEASDFYIVKDEIELYPEEKFLIGWSAEDVDNDRNDFLICTTVRAKDILLNILENEDADRKRKATAILPISNWLSYGSELEVDDCLLKSFRNRYEIELETPFPLYPVESRFSLRLAEYTKNGYVEILPGRFSQNLVFRKRYDASVQTGLGKQNRAVQTHPACPKGVPTQYEYEYETIQLAEDCLVDLADFFRKSFPIYCKLLVMNVKCNMYYNDYSNLALSEDTISAASPTEIVNFKNVSVCKDLKVTTVSWNSLVSGVLAVGYSRLPRNVIIDKESDSQEQYHIDVKNYIVLVWSCTNYLHPKLYLYSPREVSVLSWCPYKDNVLIGGLDNGQVIIWDIGCKLNRVETVQALSPKEHRQRDILSSRMTWMKPSINENEMYPTVVSDVACSHRSVVTCITWIEKGFYINRNGKWSETSKQNQHMQFLTSSMDCTLLAWDLDTKRYTVKMFDEIMVEKPTKKKRTIPDAIAAGVSQFKVMNTRWYPSYKWRVENSKTRQRYPLMSVTLPSNNYAYQAAHNLYIKKLLKKTFKKGKQETPTDLFCKQLYLTTNTGLFLDSFWDGLDYDQGLKTNSEILHATEYGTVHDGPIVNCRQHPIDLEMFLTIGGKFFAVWDTRKKSSPILWRRSSIRYAAGIWLENHPCTILAARMDFHIEYWNLLQLTKGPTRVFRFTGISLINMFTPSIKFPAKKNTIVIADGLGSARVFNTEACGFGISDEELREDPSSVRYKIETRQKAFNTWLEQWKIKNQLNEDESESLLSGNRPAKSLQNVLSVKEVASKANIEAANKQKSLFYNMNSWETAEEQIMYKNLLVKKRINVSEIEITLAPMMQIIQENQRKRELLQVKYNLRETIFNNALKSLMQQNKASLRKRYKVTVSYATKNKLKKCYIREYACLEEDALKFIRKHAHKNFLA